jgi:hypothetical protein
MSVTETETEYPTSCGTDGATTNISLECLNDLWHKSSCDTTFIETETENVYNLDGAPPSILSSYFHGQSLEQLKSKFDKVAQNYPILCYRGMYVEDVTGNETIDNINLDNANLNGLNAQYSMMYEQYVDLLQNPSVNQEDIANLKTLIDSVYEAIQQLASTIKTNLSAITNLETANVTAISNNVATLIEKIEYMNKSFTNLNKNIVQKDELDGDYEVTQVKTTSSFMKHLFYFILAILVIGCLVLLHIYPTEGNLDMFILGLGVIILLYYIYDYFQTR